MFILFFDNNNSLPVNVTQNLYEFLGGEVFSKRRWTSREVPTVRVSIYERRLHLLQYMFIKRSVSPAIKKIRKWMLRDSPAKIEPFRLD